MAAGSYDSPKKVQVSPFSSEKSRQEESVPAGNFRKDEERELDRLVEDWEKGSSQENDALGSRHSLPNRPMAKKESEEKGSTSSDDESDDEKEEKRRRKSMHRPAARRKTVALADGMKGPAPAQAATREEAAPAPKREMRRRFTYSSQAQNAEEGGGPPGHRASTLGRRPSFAMNVLPGAAQLQSMNFGRGEISSVPERSSKHRPSQSGLGPRMGTVENRLGSNEKPSRGVRPRNSYQGNAQSDSAFDEDDEENQNTLSRMVSEQSDRQKAPEHRKSVLGELPSMQKPLGGGRRNRSSSFALNTIGAVNAFQSTLNVQVNGAAAPQPSSSSTPAEEKKPSEAGRRMPAEERKPSEAGRRMRSSSFALNTMGGVQGFQAQLEAYSQQNHLGVIPNTAGSSRSSGCSGDAQGGSSQGTGSHRLSRASVKLPKGPLVSPSASVVPSIAPVTEGDETSAKGNAVENGDGKNESAATSISRFARKSLAKLLQTGTGVLGAKSSKTIELEEQIKQLNAKNIDVDVTDKKSKATTDKIEVIVNDDLKGSEKSSITESSTSSSSSSSSTTNGDEDSSSGGSESGSGDSSSSSSDANTTSGSDGADDDDVDEKNKRSSPTSEESSGSYVDDLPEHNHVHSTTSMISGFSAIEGAKKASIRHLSKLFQNGEFESEELWAEATDCPWIFTTQANIIFGSMIFVNAIYIGVETDQGEDHAGPQWIVCESVFLIIFGVELAMRWWYHSKMPVDDEDDRLPFLFGPWNILDSIIVFAGILDTWTMPLVSLLVQEGADATTLPTWAFSILRLLKLLKLLRIIRIFRFLRELLLLAQGIVGAMKALVWAMMLVFLTLYTCSIFTTRSFRPDSPNANPEMDEFFGTVLRSFFTLFQLMTLEGWADVARNTMHQYPVDSGRWIFIFFMCFIMFTNWVLLNLVTGVILENVLAISRREEEKALQKEEAHKAQTVSMIHNLFGMVLGDTQKGEISIDDFRKACKNPRVVRQLQSLQIATYEAEELFVLMDTQKRGVINTDHFIEGCLRIRGMARAKHLLCVQFDVQKVWSKLCLQIDEMEDSITEKMEDMNDSVLGELSETLQNQEDNIDRNIRAAVAEAVPDAIRECLPKVLRQFKEDLLKDFGGAEVQRKDSTGSMVSPSSSPRGTWAATDRRDKRTSDSLPSESSASVDHQFQKRGSSGAKERADDIRSQESPSSFMLDTEDHSELVAVEEVRSEEGKSEASARIPAQDHPHVVPSAKSLTLQDAWISEKHSRSSDTSEMNQASHIAGSTTSPRARPRPKRDWSAGGTKSYDEPATPKDGDLMRQSFAQLPVSKWKKALKRLSSEAPVPHQATKNQDELRSVPAGSSSKVTNADAAHHTIAHATESTSQRNTVAGAGTTQALRKLRMLQRDEEKRFRARDHDFRAIILMLERDEHDDHDEKTSNIGLVNAAAAKVHENREDRGSKIGDLPFYSPSNISSIAPTPLCRSRRTSQDSSSKNLRRWSHSYSQGEASGFPMKRRVSDGKVPSKISKTPSAKKDTSGSFLSQPTHQNERSHSKEDVTRSEGHDGEHRKRKTNSDEDKKEKDVGKHKHCQGGEVRRPHSPTSAKSPQHLSEQSQPEAPVGLFRNVSRGLKEIPKGVDVPSSTPSVTPSIVSGTSKRSLGNLVDLEASGSSTNLNIVRGSGSIQSGKGVESMPTEHVAPAAPRRQDVRKSMLAADALGSMSEEPNVRRSREGPLSRSATRTHLDSEEDDITHQNTQSRSSKSRHAREWG